MTTQDTLPENESIVASWPHEIRVIRVDRENDQPLFRFEAPMYSPKDTDGGQEFYSERDAVTYASVFVVAPFREEKTGRRGIPLEVEAAGREAVVAYLSTQSGMNAEWVANFYDMDVQRVYEYVSRVRKRAREANEE